MQRVASHFPETDGGATVVLAKAEYANPGGSVKDRPARHMVLGAVERGQLTPGQPRGRRLLDATSGNTGIAYAMLGAHMGFGVTLCLPRNASPERKQILHAYGAELVLTDPTEGTDGAQKVAKKLAAESPDRYFYPDQYNNELNWRAHYDTTAVEIWEQTRHRVTHFVAALGTTGTFVGTTRRLRELNPKLRAIGVQPDSPLHGLEGVKHLPTAIVPGIYDPVLADEIVEVATEDAHRMVLRLAREEGLMVGPSAGANMVAALRVAEKAPPGSVVVTVFCDSAGRYLSDRFWTETELLSDHPTGGDTEVWP
jgi:cysteine synthase B